MLSGFKKFALRGNLIDMASGIIIGAAFGNVVKSLVDDVIMPPIGLAIGGVDFSNLFIVIKDGTTPGPYPTLAAATEAGAVTIRYGSFFTLTVTFLIIAFAVYMLVTALQRLQARLSPEEAAPPGPPPPQEVLLTEIRDILKARGGQV
ncbi:MAG TPA: large conductance mechanosensitive channel protein MscL [Nannocystis sp.]